MQKTNISLQPAEGHVFRAAANIYSAYIASGRVPSGDESKWMERSLHEAIQLAQLTDARVRSDKELD